MRSKFKILRKIATQTFHRISSIFVDSRRGWVPRDPHGAKSEYPERVESRYEFSSISGHFPGAFRRFFSDSSATFPRLFPKRFRKCSQRRSLFSILRHFESHFGFVFVAFRLPCESVICVTSLVRKLHSQGFRDVRFRFNFNRQFDVLFGAGVRTAFLAILLRFRVPFGIYFGADGRKVQDLFHVQDEKVAEHRTFVMFGPPFDLT